jgi:protein tyrosine/serine phosphatase
MATWQRIAATAWLLAAPAAWPQGGGADAHPAARAQSLEAPGLGNFHKVGDTLYRSAQPTAEGFRSLKALGVTTVVNLRSFSSDRKKIGTTGLAYEHIYMKAWHPEHEEIVRFLQIVGDPRRQPVLVHCQHGSDRTGTMVAAYRIVVEGWSKEDAVAEMTSEPFGFHRVWRNLPKWVQELDVEAIRLDAGLPAAP